MFTHLFLQYEWFPQLCQTDYTQHRNMFQIFCLENPVGVICSNLECYLWLRLSPFHFSSSWCCAGWKNRCCPGGYSSVVLMLHCQCSVGLLWRICLENLYNVINGYAMNSKNEGLRTTHTRLYSYSIKIDMSKLARFPRMDYSISFLLSPSTPYLIFEGPSAGNEAFHSDMNHFSNAHAFLTQVDLQRCSFTKYSMVMWRKKNDFVILCSLSHRGSYLKLSWESFLRICSTVSAHEIATLDLNVIASYTCSSISEVAYHTRQAVLLMIQVE